jgi:hypothetical protein
VMAAAAAPAPPQPAIVAAAAAPQAQAARPQEWSHACGAWAALGRRGVSGLAGWHVVASGGGGGGDGARSPYLAASRALRLPAPAGASAPPVREGGAWEEEGVEGALQVPARAPAAARGWGMLRTEIHLDSVFGVPLLALAAEDGAGERLGREELLAALRLAGGAQGPLARLLVEGEHPCRLLDSALLLQACDTGDVMRLFGGSVRQAAQQRLSVGYLLRWWSMAGPLAGASLATHELRLALALVAADDAGAGASADLGRASLISDACDALPVL